jgi:hypothetical protein
MLRFCVVLLLVLTAIPALAQQRPRDAVMAGAYRCSVIGAPRQWLDCYYGAAQPVRSALGLPPISQTQLQLSQSPPPSAMAPRIAMVRDAVMASALRCYATENERTWLDCYYGAAAPMRAELGLAPAAQVAMAAPPPVPAQVSAAGDHFGVKAMAPSRVNHVTAHMASYSFDRNHVFTVTLANGQTWHQVSGDTHHAHWTKPAEAYVVKITRGAFSSYNFQVEGSPEIYKVDRIG